MSYNGLIQVIGPLYLVCYAGLYEVFAYSTFKVTNYSELDPI